MAGVTTEPTPPRQFCYDCGAACDETGAVPMCARCGPRWKLARSAPCGEVLIVREHEALLVRRARDPYRGCWELPGGFCDRGEHPADTARREVAEELGIHVRLTDVLGVYFDAYFDDMAMVTTFLGETDETPTPNPEEVSDVRWFAAPDLASIELYPGHADRWRDWEHIRSGERRPLWA